MSKNTQKILSLVSNLELKKELAINVRKRTLEQKLFYISEKMSKYYYDYHAALVGKRGPVAATMLNKEDYWKFLQKNISKKDKIAFISLGCGNAGIEKYALGQLERNGYDFVYVGVDVSEFMLKMAVKNLKEIKIEKKFVQIDITSDNFKEVIADLTKDCSRCLYAFLGSTFGNVNQTNMADILFNILQKNDLLWLDMLIRPSLNREDDMELFKRYASRLTDPNAVSFYFGPLESIGVSLSSGKVGLKVFGEKSVGSLLFIFYFKILKKTVANFLGERIHLLPNEEIELINIRAYHPKTLISFFKEHDFKLIDTEQNGNKQQFMFRRK